MHYFSLAQHTSNRCGNESPSLNPMSYLDEEKKTTQLFVASRQATNQTTVSTDPAFRLAINNTALDISLAMNIVNGFFGAKPTA